MPSVTFDGTEICNSTYIPRYVRHESAPSRVLNIASITKDDGMVYISENYRDKKITVRGTLNCNTQTSLETQIDTFKELFSRPERDLDIFWAGSTRRYVASCIRHDFNRDFVHINICPWEAEFEVALGIGEDTSETVLINNQTFTAVEYNSSATFAGSASPKPKFNINCQSTDTDIQGFSVENTNKDERIVVTREAGVGAGVNFMIDSRLKKVKYSGVDISFHGVFPTWDIGSNSYEIKAGKILAESYTQSVSGDLDKYVYDTYYWAQSFMVGDKDSTYRCIEIYAKSVGSPPNNLNVSVYTDSDGEPDSKVQDNSSNDVSKSVAVGGSYSWVEFEFDDSFELSANTRYWIVMSTTGGDSSNRYSIQASADADASYPHGHAASSTDSGSNWNDEGEDVKFKLYYGGKEDGTKTYEFDILYYKRYL